MGLWQPPTRKDFRSIDMSCFWKIYFCISTRPAFCHQKWLRNPFFLMVTEPLRAVHLSTCHVETTNEPQIEKWLWVKTPAPSVITPSHSWFRNVDSPSMVLSALTHPKWRHELNIETMFRPIHISFQINLPEKSGMIPFYHYIIQDEAPQWNVFWFTTLSKYSHLSVSYTNLLWNGSYLHQLSVHKLGPHPVDITLFIVRC